MAGGGSVICIVDDDPSVRRALARLIRSCGLDTETFSSAADYLAAPHPHGVDCVVLDIHLGGMSGIELRERIVRGAKAPPVILMTAHDDATTTEQVRSSGADGYLRKPFEASAFLDAVGQAIGRNLEAPQP